MELHGNAYPPFVPPGATQEAKIIRIIDGRYNPHFTVRDGECITVDGKLYRLHYIDETHFRAENVETGKGDFFHICQFGENVIDQGRIVEKQVMPKKITLDFIGIDGWDRCVFKGDNGKVYKTVELEPRKGFENVSREAQIALLQSLHTTDCFDGEPSCPCKLERFSFHGISLESSTS